ncbi:MAG: DNA translocase FtsK 4TM domain-containing protein [SAR86 cluster bacterium]|nr:DNA translocase FtsK 4TM domain-containing protein [SAR86 cluster bacterium]
MAKKSQAIKNNGDQAVSISKIRLEQLFLESWLIIQAFFGLFILIALISYSNQDPGWSSNSYSPGEIETKIQIKNIVGTWGAYISDFLLYAIGYMSFLVPYWLLWPVFKHFFLSRDFLVFTQAESIVISLKMFGWFLVLISGSTLLSLFLTADTNYLPYESGGIVGMSISILTLDPLSFTGSSLLFFCVLLLGFTLSLNISWISIIYILQNFIVAFGGNSGERISLFLENLKEKREIKKDTAQRKKTLLDQAKKKESLKPAEIIPPLKSREPSKRVQEEKQEELFANKEVSSPPKLNLLDERKNTDSDETSENSLQRLGELVISKLSEYGIDDVVVESIQPGPVVIRLELRLPSGLKVNQVTNVSKDLARSLSKTSVRIVEVIEGRDTIGIEVPREDRQAVLLSEVISSSEYDESSSSSTIALGKDISGKPIVADLSSMPHLLVAGTTGSGKSVALNAMIISILFKSSPEEVRLILIDPKMLELSVYDDIPHLLCPVITDMKEASSGLRWCVNEMERRYKLMAELGVRNLKGYNKKVEDSIKVGSPLKNPLWKAKDDDEDDSEADDLVVLPNIVLAVDELADLMMVVGKVAEQLIARIAQKARAAGIHMLLATQRPSVDVITGLIKANISARAAFQVASKMDSRVILDQGGAEQLLGNGDMLYLAPGTSIPQRVHGAFVSDSEVERVASDWRQRGKPDYLDEVTKEEGQVDGMPSLQSNESSEDGEDDELYDEAVAFVTESRRASISAVQRRLRVGYNRAARLVETMEQAGIVSPMSSSGNREVLVPKPPEV